MTKLRQFFRENYRLMAFTFQIFWIIVFLLNRLSSNSGGGVPNFVYVNF
jgi:hypothetical protein